MSKIKAQNTDGGTIFVNSTVSKFGICLAAGAMVLFSFGCSDSGTADVGGPVVAGGPVVVEGPVIVDGPVVVASTNGSYVTETSNTTTSTIEGEINGEVAKQENDEPQEADESEEGGVLKKAGDLFGKAASSSGAAKDWVQDKLGGAAGASGQAADDTAKWANETFQSLKDKGLTTASDTSEWLSQDWKNSQCWQYKIVSLAGENDAMTEELNKLGKNGWNCFHSEGGRFFFKKPSESYLRELPFKDFIRLVPLLHKATQ